MSTGIQTQEQRATVKQFSCKSCGNALSAIHPRVKQVGCPYCGSLLDARSEEHQILEQLGTPGSHKPFSFIQLGMKARFEGREYYVIARSRWRMNYYEYWSEDGDSGYSKEVWIYDEWLLMDERRTYFYLVEDDDGFWRSDEIIPDSPAMMPEDKQLSFFVKQPLQRVQEFGEATLIYFEGESNYQVAKGEEIEFASYNAGDTYLYEIRKDEDGQMKEVEFFQEVAISRRRILEAFEANGAVDQLKETFEKWTFVLQAAGVSFLLMVVLAIVAMTGNGREIYRQSVLLSGISEEAPAVMGPIAISEKGLYKLMLQVNMSTVNSDAYVHAWLMDSDKQPVNSVGDNFYWETGYEDGESWTEAQLESSKLFRAEETGSFSASVYASADSEGTVTLILYKGPMMSRYYIIAAVLMAIVAFYANQKRYPY
jgi:uncharacterized Zn-finger protein